MERRLCDPRPELTRGHDLENIARKNMLLRLFDRIDKILRRRTELCEEIERFFAF